MAVTPTEGASDAEIAARAATARAKLDAIRQQIRLLEEQLESAKSRVEKRIPTPSLFFAFRTIVDESAKREVEAVQRRLAELNAEMNSLAAEYREATDAWQASGASARARARDPWAGPEVK